MAVEYTMQDAVREVLKNLDYGKQYTGRDLHRAILRNMRAHGNYAQPYDSSTLRTVRRYALLYGVVCHKAGQKSKYVKGALF